jgi:prepilin-type N-terminal cleavage/methylation domain-containing protein
MTMNNKGMTLIELAVVLAIIAVLAAVLTPVVGNYIEQARVARAQTDVRTIAEAISLYHRDTSRYPIYATDTAWRSDTAAGATDSGVLAGPGDPPLETGIGTAVSWSLNSTTAGSSLELFLNNNYSNVPVNTGLGQITFKAPYVGRIDEDPFGNRYLVTAGNLQRGRSDKCAFVISAGPNATLETAKDQTCSGSTSGGSTFGVGGDDIVARIR